MALTGKQERNGVPGPDAGVNTAQPSVSVEATVASEMGASEAAAGRTMAEAHDMMSSPAGSGASGHEIGDQGSPFEWDSGLAIDDSNEDPSSP